MKYNILGNTDIKVSNICMGTMVWGNNYKGTQQTAFDQLDMAFDHGVNFVDTAEVYAIPPQKETQGNTEKIVGNRIQERIVYTNNIMNIYFFHINKHVSVSCKNIYTSRI